MLSSRRYAQQQCNTSTQRHGTPIPGSYTDARQQCCTIDTRIGEVRACLHSIHAWQAESTFFKIAPSDKRQTGSQQSKQSGTRRTHTCTRQAPRRFDTMLRRDGWHSGILSWYIGWSRILWGNHAIKWCSGHEEQMDERKGMRRVRTECSECNQLTVPSSMLVLSRSR